MREESQLPHGTYREDRAKQRTLQTEHDEQRRDVADQEVLRHVGGKEALFAQPVERRQEGDEEHRDPRGERGRATSCDAAATAAEACGAEDVEERREEDGGGLEQRGVPWIAVRFTVPDEGTRSPIWKGAGVGGR
jgi:hypothetical protein